MVRLFSSNGMEYFIDIVMRIKNDNRIHIYISLNSVIVIIRRRKNGPCFKILMKNDEWFK